MKKMLLLVLFVGLVPLFAADAVSATSSTNPLSTTPVMIVPINADGSIPEWTGRYDDSLYYGNLIYDNAIGLTAGGTFQWAIRLTSAELGPYAGWQMVAMKFHHWTGNLDNNIYVYDEGTATTPGAVLLTEPYTSNAPQDWVFIPFSDSIDINGSTDLWVSVEGTHVAGTHPASCDAGPSIDGKGGWIYLSGSWDEIQNFGFDVNWMIVAFVQPPSGPAPFWDFETGWQGWIHTNGQTFPAAWDVLSSAYKVSFTPPDAGDSTMWIDSDAAGSGGPWVQDTAISPALVPNFNYLKWGVGYYHLGSQFMDVGIKYFDGATWTAVPLRTYNATLYPTWDSVDVSAYNGYDSICAYFYFDDANGWNWYAAFDNVEFKVAAAHDVGTSDIAAPAVTVLPGSDIDPIATYNNYGGGQETFDCYFVIDSAGTNLYSEYTSVTLDPGMDTTITWPTWTAGPEGVTYDVMAFTVLAGDGNPANDTLAMTSTTLSWLYWDDGAPDNAWAWNLNNYGWGVQFIAPADLYVDSFAVYFWDASWPVPGSNLADFTLYDGAAQPTNVRQAWTGATIVRGAWNKFATDTSLTRYGPGENIYMMYFQPDVYPNCPGLACDASLDMSAYQWWYNDPGTWGTGGLSGDWLIRVHIIPYIGISEWIDYNTPDVLSMSVAGISRNSIAIRFTLPHTGMTNLVLYDATGRKLETLVSNMLNAGVHQYTTDLDLAAGVYFVTLTTDQGTITKKSLIVK